MSRRIRLSLVADRDIADLLDFSLETFGVHARLRYERLVEVGLDDLKADPLRPTSLARPEWGSGVRSYHLSHCRARAATDLGRITTPRHVIVYATPAEDVVHILRILHDAMDPRLHLPPESGPA